MALLKTHQLKVSIATKQVCNSLDLTLESLQIWAILGCNGVGKTTLLHTLAGLRAPDGGAIELMRKPISSLRPDEIAQNLGILFQHQDEPFPTTLLETALIGRHPFVSRWRWESQEDILIARKALADVHLEALSNRSINSLSGGERQRLKVATLLTQQPKVMLLDEPTNHLDPHHQIKTLELLINAMQASAGAIIMVLHDINLAARFCSHLLLMANDGGYHAGKVEDVLQPDLLSQAYGWPIIAHKTDSGIFFAPG